MDTDAAYELAYEEAGRALDAQERSVNELRSRAGVLIASAAVATSFFGGRFVDDGLGLWAWLAVAMFVGTGGCVLSILWPREDWTFSASTRDIVSEYIEPDAVPVSRIHRDLAVHRARSYMTNADQLRRLTKFFRIGLTMLIFEVAAWVVAIIQQT